MLLFKNPNFAVYKYNDTDLNFSQTPLQDTQ